MPRSSLILIFDGDCGFCTSVANRVVQRSTTPIEALAWQLNDVTRFGVSSEQASRRVYLVTGDEVNGFHRFSGHLAFAQILRLQRNRGLSLLGRVLSWIPFRWFGALGYALIARFRHRLPGGTPACKITPADHN